MIVPDSWLIVYLIEHTAIHASAADATSAHSGLVTQQANNQAVAATAYVSSSSSTFQKQQQHKAAAPNGAA